MHCVGVGVELTADAGRATECAAMQIEQCCSEGPKLE
jgi:hypothetical protein